MTFFRRTAEFHRFFIGKSIGCWSSSIFWLFYNSNGRDISAAEFDNAIRFSTLSSVSERLWRSSKWVCRLGRLLQYTSVYDVLACSFGTDFNYVITMIQQRPSLNH